MGRKGEGGRGERVGRKEEREREKHRKADHQFEILQTYR